MADDPVKRSYRSPARAAQARETRRRIRAAGERLFLRDGYMGTSLKAIATEAGVAERTLYLAFATKAALLNEIIRVTVRGHDREETLAAGADLQWVLGAPPGQLLARFAQVNTALLARTARILSIGEAAATADPALAQFRDRGHSATRSDLRDVVVALQQRGELGAHLTLEQAADAMFAIAANEALYLRLSRECGWSDADFTRLMERLLTNLLTSAPS